MFKKFNKKGFIYIAINITVILLIFSPIFSQDKPENLPETKEKVAQDIPSDNKKLEDNKSDETTRETQLNEAELNELEASIKEEDDKPETSVNNNLFATVKQGGPIMIFLILLGILSLTIIIERLIFYTRNDVWKAEEIQIHLKNIAEKSNSKYREDMEDELKSEFAIYLNGLERGLALLNGIGNISPIIGFLGTVIGMISAFAAIAAATTVNAKVVAVGIQIALVTTAGGLIVAAPTLAFSYFFTHIIQNRYAFADEIINELCNGLPRLSDKLTDDIKLKKPASKAKTASKKK